MWVLDLGLFAGALSKSLAASFFRVHVGVRAVWSSVVGFGIFRVCKFQEARVLGKRFEISGKALGLGLSGCGASFCF